MPRREVVERRCGVVVVEASSIGGAAGDGRGGGEELGFEGAVPETVSRETGVLQQVGAGAELLLPDSAGGTVRREQGTRGTVSLN